jgi:hypothetical protein
MVALSQSSGIVYRFPILGVNDYDLALDQFFGEHKRPPWIGGTMGVRKLAPRRLLDNDAARQAWVAVRSVTAPQEEHRGMFRSVPASSE